MATPLEQFEQLVMQFVQHAVEYAGAGQYDAQTDADIRKLRVLIPVLNAAVSQASSIQRPPNPPIEAASHTDTQTRKK